MIVDVLDDEGALDRLADDWRALFDAAPTATPFQSWEWARAWWSHCRRGRQREAPTTFLSADCCSNGLSSVNIRSSARRKSRARNGDPSE